MSSRINVFDIKKNVIVFVLTLKMLIPQQAKKAGTNLMSRYSSYKHVKDELQKCLDSD